MAGNKKHLLVLVFLLLLGFLLRVILTSLINRGDVLVFYEWSRRLYEEGLRGSYFYEGWVYSFPAQPPLAMLLFWVSRWLYAHRHYFALAHNIFRLPPTSFVIWFDQNGDFFLIKLWAILGDIWSAFFLYWLLFKFSGKLKLAVLGMIAFLVNPIPIFVSAIWGQSGILATFWALVSFFIFRWKWGKVFSPFTFLIGILIKPTILVLLPLYLVFLIREFFNSPVKKREFFLYSLILGGLLSSLVSLLLFIPFWNHSHGFFPYARLVALKRIIPSAKGASRASNSAFNFYSLAFTIDRTPGSLELSFFTLDQLGVVLFLLINFTAAYFWLRKRKTSLASEVFMLHGLVYFVAEGAFMFKTGMLERYFLPAFLSSLLLYFGVSLKVRLAIFLQMLIWLTNLFYSFFYRDSLLVNFIFKEGNYLGIRLFSLLNVLVYLFIIFSLISSRFRVRLKQTN